MFEVQDKEKIGVNINVKKRLLGNLQKIQAIVKLLMITQLHKRMILK